MPPDHDVMAEPDYIRARELEHRHALGDHALAALGVGHAVEDAVLRIEVILGEEHLSDEAAHEAFAEDGEMDMRRPPPALGMVRHRVRTRLDREVLVAPFVIRDAAARAEEIRVLW